MKAVLKAGVILFQPSGTACLSCGTKAEAFPNMTFEDVCGKLETGDVVFSAEWRLVGDVQNGSVAKRFKPSQVAGQRATGIHLILDRPLPDPTHHCPRDNQIK